MLPLEMQDSEIRPGVERATEGAKVSGTPFLSSFEPSEIQAMTREAGFQDARHIPAAALSDRYFGGSTDGLRPPDHSEELIVAVRST